MTEESSILPFVGWTKGRLVFRNATLPEVAARLERWYGLEVKIQDPSLRDLQLTANLRSQALRDVLDIVAASLRIENLFRGLSMACDFADLVQNGFCTRPVAHQRHDLAGLGPRYRARLGPVRARRPLCLG